MLKRNKSILHKTVCARSDLLRFPFKLERKLQFEIIFNLTLVLSETTQIAIQRREYSSLSFSFILNRTG